MANMKMKAPKGSTGATIEGHEYEIPESGVVEVVSPTHVETLHRHGFTDVASDALEKEIESTDDKARLVEIIEEHGGDADEDMKLSKLRRAAREAVSDEDDEKDEEKPAKSKKSRRKKKG